MDREGSSTNPDGNVAASQHRCRLDLLENSLRPRWREMALKHQREMNELEMKHAQELAAMQESCIQARDTDSYRIHSFKESPPASTSTKSAYRNPKMRNVSRKEIESLYHMPLSQAAKVLGVCGTTFKRKCRELNIKPWPYKRHTTQYLKYKELEMKHAQELASREESLIRARGRVLDLNSIPTE